jgi:hypothetical protein
LIGNGKAYLLTQIISSVKSFIFLILATTITSCNDERKDLLVEYSELHCAWKMKAQQRNSVAKELAVLKTRLSETKSKLDDAASAYYSQINELNRYISEIEMQFEQKSISLTQRHEAKHGHMITRDYTKALEQLDNWKGAKTRPLHEQRDTL